ncbi:glycosyltransferase family protein [Winogradskyella aurantiaca]|uniref:glycosyltransferase n=1 Tax=Winogradskyella aurantiaca TaxID=2219558 RepID=UPI000E1DC76A|nr:glycosyltransferase [Winogradskyella aurantiaca]
MKILFANFVLQGNRFMEDLKLGLEKHAEVVYNYKEFWRCENDYDVVHLHWPEFLSYDVQKYVFRTEPFPAELFNKIETCLKYWKEHSTIIYTRHVQYPHRRHDQDFLNLYKMVSSYSDTVVHFANYSIKQFKEWYPEHKDIHHVVIPHQNYAAIPNSSTKSSARKQLKIGDDKFVMLVFGTVFEQEKEFIKKAFSFIPTENKILLSPSWKVSRRKIGYIRLREWVWKLDRWFAKRNKTLQIEKGFIKEEDAHLYINSADFMLIPRQKELNSGNITLAFTFSKVVVGRNGGDIGELLNETGNPTFIEGYELSLKQAIEKAVTLSKTDLGEKNQELAIEEWGVDTISKMYIDEMKKAIERKK